MAATSDVFPAYRFYVELDGKKEAVFTEVTGLQIEMEVLEYAEGGNNGFVYRLPGRTKVGNVTFKRGLVTSNAFFDWCLEVAAGKVTRRNVSVVMYDVGGHEVRRWSFVGAYPVRWVGPQLSVVTAAAIETLELAHNGLQPSA